MKRITLILWLLLSTTVWTFAYDFQSGDLYYNITSDSTATVTYQKYNPSDNYSGLTSAIIPESVTYNGTTYRVTSIGISAFEHCSGLTSVTIPNSVTSIGSGAFYSCSGLTSITIPNSVTSIGNVAFGATPWYNNQSNGVFYINNVLYSYIGTMPDNTSIAVKEGTVSISPYAFQHCSGLTSVTIPNSVTSIGGYVFYECSGLTSVIIPNGVTSIGEYAFYGCSGLTSVIIPNGVTSIGEYAFYECSGLTSVTIGNSVTSIGGNAFNGCKGLTSVVWNAKSCHSISFPKQITSFTFGDDVEYIPKGLCSNMTGLTSITIPKSVTSIERGVFEGCSGLTSVVWNAKSCKVVDQYSPVSQYNAPFYYNRSRITSFVFGDEVKHIPAYLCYEMSNLTSIAIPNSVTSIGEGAFSDCTGLTSITIPNSVTSIGKDAFMFCSGLTSITIGNSVTSIGSRAFRGCSGLTSVIIPNSVTSIGGDAFYECSGLTSVTIPNSVTSIGGYAFGATPWYEKHPDRVIYINNVLYSYKGTMPSQTHIKVREGTVSISPQAFYGCSGLTSITIPNSVTSIGNEAFYKCSGLTSVTIPNSVTSIGKDAFMFCSGLTSITIGNSVTSIGSRAFGYCSGLTSVTIPNSVTSIGKDAFMYCSGLTSIVWNAKSCNDYCSLFSGIASQIASFVFGDEVERIPARLCKGMSGLTSITIPDSVTSIGNNAFNGCSGLTSITIPNSVTSIGDSAFYSCKGLTSITISNNVTSIGKYTFYGCSGLTSIIIPNSVTSIGEYAFFKCSSLTSVTIPNSVTSIGDKAFLYCSGLTSVTIPDGVTWIGESAFSSCDGLTSVTIPNSVTWFGRAAFSNCDGLTSVVWNAKSCKQCFEPFFGTADHITSFTFGEEVEHIPANLCSGMKITSVTIPNSVTSVGNSAFYGCSSLTSVTIPNDVTSIGKDAFYNVANIVYSGTATGAPWGARSMNGYVDDYLVYSDATKTTLLACYSTAQGTITIPNSVTNIRKYAFMNCEGLTSVTIPNSVTSIGELTFFHCSGLTSVTIPNSVTSIGNNAFNGCDGLTSVTCYATTPPRIKSGSFFDVEVQLIPLYVPMESVEKYKAATVWKNFMEILPISAMPADTDEPVLNPEENRVTITWPATDKAATYTIEISKDGTLVCTLTFDANGVLKNMRFAAPSRHAAQHTTQAEATGSGFRFVVEGLDSATTYAYTITATDIENAVLISYTGIFATMGKTPTATEDIHSAQSQPAVRKVFHNGQVYILRSDKTYTLTGEEL